MILMEIVNLPSIKDYWRNDEAFNYQPLANRISCKRFLQIHRFLHFVDNDSLLSYGEPEYSKIQKVKPILTQLSANCKEQFIPGRDLSVDEAMVKFKGRSSIKQYMPKKPIKRGFKIWMLADSDSGYVTNFKVYEGKTQGTVEKGLGANVVLTLTEHVQQRYHHVFFNNFFTGIDLLLNLLRRGLYSCGTMRSDRKGFPPSLKPIVKKGFPNRGEYKHAWNGNLSVVVWQDTKAITCASTNAPPDEVSQVTQKQKDGSRVTIQCPGSVVTYNKKMGGVDHNDQLRGYYEIPIKIKKIVKIPFLCCSRRGHY